MKNKDNRLDQNRYFVVHPLDDVPEEKRSVDNLGLMPMTKSVRWMLLALRAYLVVMGIIVVCQVFAFAGHHLAR